MFKEICKVTETDCFDSWKPKIIEKPSSVRKKKRLSKTLTFFYAQEGPDFGIITQTESFTQIDNQ
jgi:hypothetical protein